MIDGAHVIISSTQPEADRAFLRDVLALPHVDVGDGWLIFGLPPAEVAVHPAGADGEHELYLMCPDVDSFVAAMTDRGLACEPVQSLGWGLLTSVRLPGGGTLGVYEPRHARAPAHAAAKAKPRKSKPASRRPKATKKAKAKPHVSKAKPGVSKAKKRKARSR